jgi:hypothetical protein
MALLKELLDLVQEDETKKNFTMDDNLEAIETVLKFDGEIPLHTDRQKAGVPKSRNQADEIIEEDGSTLFYVSLDPPYGNCEAYVVVDKRGKVSYYNLTSGFQDVVVDGKLKGRATYLESDIDDWVNEYKIEGGRNHAKKGAIPAYLEILNSAD